MKIFVINKNSEIIDTVEIEDSSNLTTYVNIKRLPKKLGASLKDRVLKYLELRKRGYLIINTK